MSVRKLGLLLFSSLFIMGNMKAQLKLNGRSLIFDSLTSTYIQTIPEEMFGADYEAVVSLEADSAWTGFIIEGQSIGDGETYTFEGIEGNKEYCFSAIDGNGNEREGSITFTFLPIVSLYGDFGYDYTEGTVSLYVPGAYDGTEEDEETMKAKLKWRGGTTNVDGKNKRNYHIKFLKTDGKKQNRQFFGLRNDNDWLLDAAQIDLARCRNRTATDLWLDMCAQPYYIESEPEALSGARGVMCELFLNNSYYGIYGFMENVDDKQMCLVDYDEDEEIYHGHLWKLKSYTNSTMMYGLEDFDGYLEESNGVEVKFPDFEDVCPTDYSLYQDAVEFTITSDDDAFTEEIGDYFDIPVLVDYYIFVNTLFAIDNCAKNIFWACYDEQVSKKLTLAVWDLDATVGQNYTNNEGYYRNALLEPEVDFMYYWNNNYLIERLSWFDWFCDLVEERYYSLRKDILSEDSLKQRYINYLDCFRKSGAAQRETDRWSGDTDISGLDLDFDEEQEYIEDWIERRMAHLDTYIVTSGIKEIETDSRKRFIDNNIYNLSGQKVESGSLRPGIYIINGKKFVVR